ncbi:hypothetical protein [Streptomyces sp. NPDC014623]|uniref:hypothetical protein n=1 Tax=Streptomyces sp. NPDC014623 TaxID=3364875 RepID=UPI0036F760ED
MHTCADRPGRLSISPATPTRYRIGCTMPGGSSGGGWFAEGKATPVPHTSTAPVTAGRPRAR